MKKNMPDRVVINKKGLATTPEIAKRDHGIVADVIFVRRDGWSLGAPFWLDEVAKAQWDGHWNMILRF